MLQNFRPLLHTCMLHACIRKRRKHALFCIAQIRSGKKKGKEMILHDQDGYPVTTTSLQKTRTEKISAETSHSALIVNLQVGQESPTFFSLNLLLQPARYICREKRAITSRTFQTKKKDFTASKRVCTREKEKEVMRFSIKIS